MDDAATTTAPAGAGAEGGATIVHPAPFVRGAYQHIEPAPIDISTVIGNSTLLGNFDVPAFGFLRGVRLLVQATGGTGVAATYKEDAPWSAIGEVMLADVNGQPLYGPYSGYELYITHKLGGYLADADPTSSPYYVAPANTGNFAFQLLLPVEISERDALGALPNQNASQVYHLRITQAAKADVYTVDPTGLPTVRVRAWVECWSQPMPTDLLGRPVSPTPPAMGTTQYWSKQIFNQAAGFNTNRLSRVGNLIREIVLINRLTSTGLRSTTNFPDPVSFYIDGKLLVNQPQLQQQQYTQERTPTGTIDVGVMVYDFCHDFDGSIGSEMRDQLLATTPATRLEFQGAWGAAGTLTVLTNDIAVNGDIYL